MVCWTMIRFLAATCLLGLVAGCVPVREPLHLFALGDVLLDRTPGERLRLVGPAEFFGPLRSLTRAQDIVFANLESPAALHPVLRRDKPADLTFCADPARLADLREGGITVVSLANNHMDDAGGPGILETVAHLDEVGIAHAGAGENDQAAHAPAVWEVAGYRVALLSYNHVFTGVEPATPAHPGVAEADFDSMRRDIRDLGRGAKPDFIVVSVHWGNEFDTLPTSFQYEFGRACIREGATLVLGHHTHVVQGIERYGRGLIAYSLGNAVFSLPGEETGTSVALLVELEDNGVNQASVVPLELDRFLGAPRAAEGGQAKRVLERLRSRSPGLKIDSQGRLK